MYESEIKWPVQIDALCHLIDQLLTCVCFLSEIDIWCWMLTLKYFYCVNHVPLACLVSLKYTTIAITRQPLITRSPIARPLPIMSPTYCIIRFPILKVWVSVNNSNVWAGSYGWCTQYLRIQQLVARVAGWQARSHRYEPVPTARGPCPAVEGPSLRTSLAPAL